MIRMTLWSYTTLTDATQIAMAATALPCPLDRN